MMDESGEKSLGRNSFIVMFFTLASRLLGILRIRIFGSIFGAGATADAINFSFNIPNNFRKLFSEGALSSAIVPVFSKIEDEKDRFQKLFSAFLGIQVIISAVLMILTVLLRKPIVLFLSDFSDPQQNLLAIGLLPYFSLFLVFILLSSYFSSVLQSKNCFLVQSVAPLLFSISVIVSLLVFSKPLGAYSMALGVASGGLLQMACTCLNLMKKGLKFRISFDFSSEDFRAVLKNWIPAMVSSAIAIVSTQFAFFFASGLGTGAVSSFSNSLVFWQTPYGIFFTAVSTVLIPFISKSAKDKVSSLYGMGLQKLSSFLIPSAVFLFFFRSDAVSIILETGNFTSADTALTAQVLGVFLIGMLLVAWYSFSQRVGYCLGLQRKILRVSVLVCAVDILSSYILIRMGLGVQSLAFANLISNSVGLMILFLNIRKDVSGFDFKSFLIHDLKVIVSCIPLAFFCFVARKVLPDYLKAGSKLEALFYFCFFGLAGAGIILCCYRFFRISLFKADASAR